MQRNSKFSLAGGVISFESARLNEGGCLNLASGIFTAPVKGIYHFQFSAAKDPSDTYLLTFLQVNGANVGSGYAGQSSKGEYHTVSLSTSLRLEEGDRVNMLLWGGVLYDNGDHHTHFTGWLEEQALT